MITKKLSFKPKSLWVAALVALFAFTSSLSYVQPVLAAGEADKLPPLQRVQLFALYYGVADCRTKSDADNGLSFKGDGVLTDELGIVSHLVDAEDGVLNCKSVLERAATAFGYPSPAGLGFTEADDRWFSLQDNVLAQLRTKMFGGQEPAFTPAMQHVLFSKSFSIACAAGEGKPYTGSTVILDRTQSTMATVDANGEIQRLLYDYKPNMGPTSGGISVLGRNISGVQREETCGALAQKATATSDEYKTWFAANKAIAQSTTGTATTSTGPGGSEEGKETCNITNIGWIVCPAAIALAGITDAAFALVEKLLVFQFSDNPLQTDSSNAVYTIWSNIRNFANIMFIFAFFAVIFSQATSLGIGSYGIKKILPRLVFAAIFVNLSYYLCVFAVDISNIVGAGIDGMFKFVLENGAGTSSDTATAAGTWTGIITTLLAVGVAGAAVAGAGGIGGALAAALPFLVVALFAILTALVVLIARQAILIMLIIVSPLAFVAYILPNTENLFDKWRKLFVTMLVFYPLVVIVFAGSQVAAAVLRLTANGGGFDDQLVKVMSLAVMAFPLFALPFLLKFSGGVLGRIGGMVNNPNKGPFDSLRKRAEARRDTSQGNRKRAAFDRMEAIRKTQQQGGTLTGRQKLSRFNPTNRSLASSAKRSAELEAAKSNLKSAEVGFVAQEAQTDTKFQSKLAGVGKAPPIGSTAPADLIANRYITRSQAQATSTQRQLEGEAAKNISTLFAAQGISSDRGALVSKIKSARDSAEVEAATDLLLKTAGTEEFGAVIRDKSISKDVRKVVLKTGRDLHYGTIDSKSPDLADFIGSEKAVEDIENGREDAAIEGQGRILGLAGGKMIKFEPRAMARVFKQLDGLSPADRASAQAVLQQQATQALANEEFINAKPPVQEAIRQMAGGTFSVPPSVVPKRTRVDAAGNPIINPATGKAYVDPLPRTEW